MAYKRKTYKRRAPKRTFKRRSVKRTRKSSVVRVVKRVLSRQVEVKTRTFASLGGQLYPSGNASQCDIYNVIDMGCRTPGFAIVQGTGDGARVGNQITVKKVTIRGGLVPNPWNTTTNTVPVPLQVKVWVFYDKRQRSVKPAPFAAADFFDFNSTVSGFQNDLVDMWAPVNTNLYTVLKTKTFKLGFSIGGSSTASEVTFQSPNNDFKYNCNFSMDLTKCLPSRVVYNDNTADSSTRSVYMLWCIAGANGQIIANNQLPCTLQYEALLKYTDA